jgi:hypothetical protein
MPLGHLLAAKSRGDSKTDLRSNPPRLMLLERAAQLFRLASLQVYANCLMVWHAEPTQCFRYMRNHLMPKRDEHASCRNMRQRTAEAFGCKQHHKPLL